MTNGMKNRMKNGLIGATVAAFLVSLLTSLPARAVERGFYVGGYYGQTKSDLESGPYEGLAWDIYPLADYQALQRVSSSFDTKDSGYGFFGGYRLFRHLAIEGGYSEFGEFTFRDESNGVDLLNDEAVALSQRLTTSVTGITLSALGIWPLSYRAEVFVRGGIIFTTSDLDTHLVSSNGFDAGAQLFSESDTDFVVGAGGGFTFAEIYTLRLEYQRILDAGDELTGEADMDSVNLGFTVAF
jgi:opacity protein-like surface antigen